MTATRTIAAVLFLVLLASLIAGCAAPSPAPQPTASPPSAIDPRVPGPPLNSPGGAPASPLEEKDKPAVPGGPGSMPATAALDAAAALLETASATYLLDSPASPPAVGTTPAGAGEAAPIMDLSAGAMEKALLSLPWARLMREVEPDALGGEVLRMTLDRLMQPDTAPTTSGQPRLRLVSYRPLASSGLSAQGTRLAEPRVQTEEKRTFDEQTGVQVEEATLEVNYTEPVTGASQTLDMLMRSERYVCWDPGKPEQRTAKLLIQSSHGFDTPEGRKTSDVSAEAQVVFYSDGRRSRAVSATIDGYSRGMTMPPFHEGQGDNTWSGESTTTEGWANGRYTATSKSAGGSSMSVGGPGPEPGTRMSKDEWKRAQEEFDRGMDSVDDLFAKIGVKAIELLDLFNSSEPTHDYFCLPLAVEYEDRLLEPNGDELPVTVKVTDWKRDPMPGIPVRVLGFDLGTAVPSEGETNEAGEFRWEYFPHGRGQDSYGKENWDRVYVLAGKYSFFEVQERFWLRFGNAWALEGLITWSDEEYGANEYRWSVPFSIKDGRIVADGNGSGTLYHDGPCITATSSGSVTTSGTWDEFEEVFFFDPVSGASGEEKTDIIRDDVFKKQGCTLGRGMGESMSMLFSAPSLTQGVKDSNLVKGRVRVKAEDGASTIIPLNSASDGQMVLTVKKRTN